MAQRPARNELRKPMVQGIKRPEGRVDMSFNSNRPAPNIAGIAIKKEKRPAISPVSPK